MGAISGLFYRDTNRTVSKAQIKAMTDVLQHRGPNGEMQYTEANAGLGMRGWTDEWSDDPREFRMCFSTKRHGDIFVLLDGEIYNAPELREKLDDADWECQTEFDAEVLAGLYDLYGLDQMFPMLRGKFAIAIWEPKTHTLTLARDPMGQKPLYLYQDAEKLVFASVDRSPHCTQMHYMKHEIERTLKDHVPVQSFVVAEGKLVPVPDAAIELSKSLGKLANMV